MFVLSVRWQRVRSYPFSVSTSISAQPLALIHCDLWGTSPELSICGYSYCISFIDDCTKYVWLYPLTTKSEAFVTFLKFKTYVENMLSFKIKAPHSDGGGVSQAQHSNIFWKLMGLHIVSRVLTHPSKMALQKESTAILLKWALLY